MEPFLRRCDPKIVVLAEYPPRIQNGSTEKRNRDEKKAAALPKNGSGPKRNRSAISLTDLPSNVLVEILTRLPLRTLFVARSVCKTFVSLSTPNPHFLSLHSSNAPQILVFQFRDFKRSSFQLDMADQVLDSKYSQLKPFFQLPKMDNNHSWYPTRLSLAHSCNGLLFFRQHGPDDCRSLVCNPVTSEYIIIPDALVDPKMRSHSLAESLWLGFSPGTNQYKVLRISSWANAGAEVTAQVFVIGSDSWRDIDDTPPRILWDLCHAFVNGLMYWLDEMLWPGVIISFDFETGKFGEVALPPELQDDRFMAEHVTSIGVLGGCLYLTCNDFAAQHVDLWAMRICGNQESWRKEFVVDIERIRDGSFYKTFKPLQFLENGEILMQWRGNAFVCYDPRTETLRYLEVDNKVTWDYKVVALTPSFVPLTNTLKFKKLLKN